MADEETKPQEKETVFGVISEATGSDKQLVLLNIPFGQLMDDIVVPYDNGDPFFIDGVTVTKTSINRIKIVELGPKFQKGMFDLERGMTKTDNVIRKIYGEQYETRFEHILRTAAVDVTAQVIKAYNQAIRPSIKDYMPNRDELIGAAAKVFIEGMKALSV